MSNEIEAGDHVKFTAEGISAYLKTGDDVNGATYKVLTATSTHLGLHWVDGPTPIPGVTLMHISTKREFVVKA